MIAAVVGAAAMLAASPSFAYNHSRPLALRLGSAATVADGVERQPFTFDAGRGRRRT